MAFAVIYDASVLYPSTLRDLLIRIAQTGLVHARWTEMILDEMFDAIKRNRPDLDPARLDRGELGRWDIEPKSPDAFVRDQIGLDRDAIVAAIQQIADSWRNPTGTPAEVLERLERSGLAVSVAELRTPRL